MSEVVVDLEPWQTLGVALAIGLLLGAERERSKPDGGSPGMRTFVLLPAGQLGPYGVWEPQRIWLLVVLIICIGWVGYAATRILGSRRGLMVAPVWPAASSRARPRPG